MSYEFRPSLNEDINKAPVIAFAGPTGCGKTESAMRLARGFVGPGNNFCIIDTEERRALYKKSRYQPWDHLDLKAPFSPENYGKAMEAANKMGYGAVIIDSWSHEWSGEGGVSEQAEENIARMVQKMGEDKASKLTSLAWSKPKIGHKRLMSQSVIRYPRALIFCLRAEPKIKFVKVKEDGQEKTKVVDAGFQPICEKSFMFEMLIACMMEGLPDGKPGVPIHIKELEPELKQVFIQGEQVCEATGKRLAEWAGNGVKPQPAPPSDRPSDIPSAEEEAKMLSEKGMVEGDIIENWKADANGFSTIKDLTRWFDLEKKGKLSTEQMRQLIGIFEQRTKVLKAGMPR